MYIYMYIIYIIYMYVLGGRNGVSNTGNSSSNRGSGSDSTPIIHNSISNRGSGNTRISNSIGSNRGSNTIISNRGSGIHSNRSNRGSK